MINLEIWDANFATAHAGRKTGEKSKIIDSSLHNTGLKHSYVCICIKLSLHICIFIAILKPPWYHTYNYITYNYVVSYFMYVDD